jgi:sulfatase modifying factor 1
MSTSGASARLSLVATAALAGCTAILGISDPTKPLGPEADGGLDANPVRDDTGGPTVGNSGETDGGTSASCAGLPATCGAAGNEDCCTSLRVPDAPAATATFMLGRAPGQPDDLACAPSGAFANMCDPDEAPGVRATIRAYVLDKFEVTVGRFRKFVASSFQPSPGDGKHGYLNASSELGWDATWTIPTTPSDWNALLACDATYSTWTPGPGPNEAKPVNCLTWYAAYAFCIWDGGFLPTEAEWELAASGGEERVFAWSVPPGDTSSDPGKACFLPQCTSFQPVGTHASGDGRWGHADISGNVGEWVLDWYAPYPSGQCRDCANLAGPSDSRVVRAGSVINRIRATYRNNDSPDTPDLLYGARCAHVAK